MVHRIVPAAVVVPVLVLAITLALPSSDAFAFCRTTTCAIKKPPPTCVRDDDGCWAAGIPLSWEQPCVSFSVNAAGSPRLGLSYDAALALVQKGFSLWPNAMCSDGTPSIAFSTRSGLTCDRVEYNATGPNANAIIFRDDNWTHDPSAIALTTVAFNVKTGKILDADMEINTSFMLTPFDLEFVVAHESGHFAGLDHSPLGDAVMFFQYAMDNIADPRLTADDVSAICTAYPPARVVPACDFEPDKGYATDCGGDVQASCAVAPVAASGLAPTGGDWMPATGMVGVALLRRWRGRRRRPRQPSQAGSRPRNA